MSLQSFLETLPKGATIQSRLLLKWGDIREAMDKQSKKFLLEKRLRPTQERKWSHDDGGDHYEDLFLRLGCETGSSYRILVPNVDCADSLFERL